MDDKQVRANPFTGMISLLLTLDSCNNKDTILVLACNYYLFPNDNNNDTYNYDYWSSIITVFR